MNLHTTSCAKLIGTWIKRRKEATGIEPNADEVWRRINKRWERAPIEDREEIFNAIRSEPLPRFIKQEQLR